MINSVENRTPAFKILPRAGGTPTQIYGARMFDPPPCCRWDPFGARQMTLVEQIADQRAEWGPKETEELHQELDAWGE